MVAIERFDAVAFLGGLVATTPDRPTAPLAGELVAGATRHEITPADLPGDWRVEWEERAAIREYDGGQAREHAEAEALGEIVSRMQVAGEST